MTKCCRLNWINVLLPAAENAQNSPQIFSLSTMIFHKFFSLTKNYANPQPIGIELETVPDSPRIGCSLKSLPVVCSRRWLKYIVNHWSYITVNHLCKQLYKFHHFTAIFHETLFVISYDFPGLENGLTKFHDFPRPRETLPNALELASWFDEKTVKRYWVCTKTLFKTVVSGPFIYWVIN